MFFHTHLDLTWPHDLYIPLRILHPEAFTVVDIATNYDFSNLSSCLEAAEAAEAAAQAVCRFQRLVRDLHEFQ